MHLRVESDYYGYKIINLCIGLIIHPEESY